VLAEPEGYVRLFVDEGLPMAALLQQVAELSTASSYARKLLAAFPIREAQGPGSMPTGHVVTEAHMADTSILAPPSSLLVEPLSPRELEVVRLLAAGASNREIGARLVISAGTVKAHLHHIYGKLDVHNRTEAAACARALGLV
jgi:LuxR family maltose regulon positive regulatory protein